MHRRVRVNPTLGNGPWATATSGMSAAVMLRALDPHAPHLFTKTRTIRLLSFVVFALPLQQARCKGPLAAPSPASLRPSGRAAPHSSHCCRCRLAS
eukprot:42908-Chlamydomonas_euryale.AAC.2